MHGETPITTVPGPPAETVRAFRERLGSPADDLVTDEIARRFTICGDDEDCVTGLRGFAGAGLASLIVIDEGSQDPVATIEHLARTARAAGLLPG